MDWIWHIQCHREAFAQPRLDPEVEPLGGAARVADRDARLSGTRPPMKCDEFRPV
jgi:hypothetical protein